MASVRENARDVVRGIGVLTHFWKILDEEIGVAGGSHYQLARISTPDARGPIRRFAQDLVKTIPTPKSGFEEQIEAGKYNFLLGFADQPERIVGQDAHEPPRNYMVSRQEDLLKRPVVTIESIYERFGSCMASLSQLLKFGVPQPAATVYSPNIVIVWRCGNQYWLASLLWVGSARGLAITKESGATIIDKSTNILVRY